MAIVDVNERQITLKLVYYGPPLSGKTTNLRHIHSRVDELNRGRLMTLDTKDDRTLFFDLLPIFFKASGLSFRVKVYTVPGQPIHEATRRVVLQKADGVAFVADSARDATRANNESYDNLCRDLDKLGLSRDKVPMVIQYNKRDLPDILSTEELAAFGKTSGERIYPASAIHGEGVMETFLGLVEQSFQALDADAKLEQNFGITSESFLAAMCKHVDAQSS